MNQSLEFSHQRSQVLRVFWPPYFPSVNLDCVRFPTLHVTKYCPYPGLLVEVDFY